MVLNNTIEFIGLILVILSVMSDMVVGNVQTLFHLTP